MFAYRNGPTKPWRTPTFTCLQDQQYVEAVATSALGLSPSRRLHFIL